jgi:hypothetical protein
MYGRVISLNTTFVILSILSLQPHIDMAQVQMEELDFRTLLTRLGFAQSAIQAITDNGLRTTEDLVGIDQDDIENIIKIIRASQVPPMLVSYIAQKLFTVLCYWVNRRRRLLESIAANEFTPQALEAFGKLMAHESQEDETTNGITMSQTQIKCMIQSTNA